MDPSLISGMKKDIRPSRFKAGEPITEGKLNALVNAINSDPTPAYSSHIKIAETIDDGTGYPTRASNPNVYGFRYIYLDPKASTALVAPGSVSLTAEATSTSVDGYVLNLPASVGSKAAYIPENTVIEVTASTLGFYYTNYEDTRLSVLVFVDGSGVTARSGSTAGTGSGNIYDGSDLSDTGETIDLINISETPIPASCYTIAHRDEVGGVWIAQPPAVTDLQLSGTNFQLRRNCSYETWLTGAECDET
jgi:hypothetical protein